MGVEDIVCLREVPELPLFFPRAGKGVVLKAAVAEGLKSPEKTSHTQKFRIGRSSRTAETEGSQKNSGTPLQARGDPKSANRFFFLRQKPIGVIIKIRLGGAVTL